MEAGYLNIVRKCDNPAEPSAVKSRKLKDTMEQSLSSLKQIYDEHVNQDVKLFSKIVSALLKKSTSWLPVPLNVEKFKIACESGKCKIDLKLFFFEIPSLPEKSTHCFFSLLSLFMIWNLFKLRSTIPHSE